MRKVTLLVLGLAFIGLTVAAQQPRHAIATGGSRGEPRLGAQTAPVQLQIRGALVNRAFRRLLPFKIPIPLAEVYLTELEYCPQPDGTAKIIGLAVASITQVIQDPGATRFVNCSANIAAIAGAASNGSSGQPDALVVTIAPAWKPWEIELSLNEYVAVGPNAALLMQELDKLATVQPLLARIPVGDIRFNIGADEPLHYKLALRFEGNAVTAGLVPAQAAVGSGDEATLAALSGADGQVPDLANTVLSLDPRHLNEVLDSRFQKVAIPVPLPVSGANLRIQDLDLRASPGALGSEFRVYASNPNEQMTLVINWIGSDLTANQAVIPLPPNDCASKSNPIDKSLCNAAYQLRRTIATAAENAITAHFRDKPLRPFGSDRRFSVEVDGKTAGLSVVVLRAAAATDRIILYADTDLGV